jgi:hypothetical protein
MEAPQTYAVLGSVLGSDDDNNNNPLPHIKHELKGDIF